MIFSLDQGPSSPLRTNSKSPLPPPPHPPRSLWFPIRPDNISWGGGDGGAAEGRVRVIHSNGPHSIVSFKCRKLSVKVRAWGFSPLNGFPKLPQPLGCSLQTSGKKGREGGRECWSTRGPHEARRRASPSPAGRTAGRPGPQGGEKGSARACARRERTPAALRPHVPPWERGPRGRPPGDTRARGGRAHRLPLLPRPSPGRRAPARQGRGRRAGRPDDAQGRARRCAPPPRGSVHPAPPTRRTGRAPFPHRPGQGRRARPAKPLPLAGSGRGGTPGRGAARGRRERRMGKEGCEPPPPPRLPPRRGRRDDGTTNPCVEG